MFKQVHDEERNERYKRTPKWNLQMKSMVSGMKNVLNKTDQTAEQKTIYINTQKYKLYKIKQSEGKRIF